MDDFGITLSPIQKKSLGTECSVVSELAKHVRVNSVSGISTCLLQLKNDSKRCKEFAKQDNGLDILVQLLCHKNHAILNMSLSILANACMAHDAREKVKSSKIGSNIISIIKNLKLDSKLHCRACRLVSNLSECSWHANKLYDAGVVETLTALLKSKTDMQTYLMAVRAIRNIWSYHEDSREKMLTEYEIVKLVAQIFVMAMKTFEVDAKYVELVDACLKAMHVFLQSAMIGKDVDPRCGLQIQVDEHKQGYKCLVQCCTSTDFRFNNKMALKCLYSVCKIAECRLLLGTCGTVEQLIALIDSASSVSSGLSEEILFSLCLFSREAVNRARIRNDNGLQLFIKLLKMPEHERYHSVLLHALVHFYYDDIAFEILAKLDLVEILGAKLTSMAAMAVNDSKGSMSKKRLGDRLSNEKTLKYLKQNFPGRYSMDFHRDDWSPRSGTSGYSSSPPSTPPLPHYDLNTEADDVTDDNVYSPVCSDTEYGDNDDELLAEEALSLKSYKSLTIETDNSSDSDTSNKTSARYYMSIATLTLLNKLSLLPKPIERLADPTMIKPLLTYIKYTKNAKASEILIRIVRHATYFIPLLKQGFAFEVQNLSEPEQYMQPLRETAETGGSVGQLSSILLRDEEKYKLIIAVSIPLLITSPSKLKGLLKNNGGLKLIFRMLTEPSHELHERASWSICQLARTLQIQPELMVDRSTTVTATTNDDRSCDFKPTVSSTVMFELDDGMTVEACRRTLCQRSDAFSAMLEGNFNESGKKRVRLRNTSRDGLNTLILAMSGVAYEHRSIESLLDAVLLADKFLMPDLSDTLTESSVAKLSHENFSRAWCWARSNSCDELRSYCIKSFLTAKMSWNETVSAFRDFHASGIFDEFLREIREIVVDALCQH
ncbi:hypothetical protein DMN91_001092 [Ooceraea biroi]|uniref:Uncharacterized protein n=1 Tax=Ooceraea biroi TaxID=2015173 RepID=A0A3L8E3L5_OOCBI|nr:armadillo repeat-containing protein 5 [Ooceraea biroi]RLU27291.1 hypothetical protein DMN91_001092 [Ooceraea biroi]